MTDNPPALRNRGRRHLLEVDSEPEATSREDLLTELLTFTRIHQERFAERVSKLGLTPIQAKALYHVDRDGSMRALARRLHCDASNVTSIVDRLEEMNLLHRQADTEDRRVKRLVATAKGQRLRQKVAHAMFTVPELDSLTPIEEQTLCRLVRKLAGQA